MIIRDEIPADFENVWHVNAAAFETNAEADLVNNLRTTVSFYVSLVAEEGKKIVGHIFYSPVELILCDRVIQLIGLGPMAVVPELQRQGIGSALVKEGTIKCKYAGYDAIVVLGHPEYYPRFGFVPSVQYNIKSEYNVPDDVFMILELKSGALTGCQGTIKYADPFNDL
jgi:putative acetyltransferase